MNLARAAQLLLRDETIREAFDAAQVDIENLLFSAPTPEEREARFQERAGLLRVMQVLQTWSTDQDLEDHYEH